MTSTAIVWFRLDLRLMDNSALLAAINQCEYVVPTYICATESGDAWRPGFAGRWWLGESLGCLDHDLRRAGSRLVIRRGDSLQELLNLVDETGAQSIFWNRRYDPYGRDRDEEIESALKARGIRVETFNSTLLHEPHLVRNGNDRPFRIFTPFWKHFTSTAAPDMPSGSPKKIPFCKALVGSLPLAAIHPEHSNPRATALRRFWSPGEVGALGKLSDFISHGLASYGTGRDRPDQNSVSMLSPHLHFGEIGPRQIWHAIKKVQMYPSEQWHADTYLRELGWREFAYHILFNFPATRDNPLRQQFERFPWVQNRHALQRWQLGQTGYPIIDAGMRQLWEMGWMHNRVRMIVSSFITKDLLISWKDGARWFWDNLVDADLANNTLGWQWTAGCGADAAPYFRIFNPVLQGEKFDPNGDYVRHWVPELSMLPARWIHKPWEAPASILRSAGVELGATYPVRIIDHDWARKRALHAFSQLGLPVNQAVPPSK